MFGLMRESKHKKEYIKQGRTYRREIDRLHSEIHRLNNITKRFADIVAPKIHSEHQIIPHDRLVLTIEIDAERLRRELPQDLLLLVRDRIFERLNDFNKDYRPDMRQQIKNERLLIR